MSLGSGSFHPDDLVLIPHPHLEGWSPGIGDHVRLRSGGPRMQVVALSDEGLVCFWVGGEGVFLPRMVEPAEVLIS